ncbi:hypothetical protein [Halomonas nitroreducens]|uniref:Uncharacterized protein n=1 Tax=Halomonas nitroreducens TaxID=447425 RepID=A0A3S0HP29_9GAMM|nr:hypothetical protein [Halomonas nitroreducens]RTR02045.1 hypothetical protein EKG36_13650 [Halomonas nitroreducens]
MATAWAWMGTLLVSILVATAGTASSSEQEAAMQAGATQLTSDEIAELIVGKTVTAKSGDKRFLFHYSEDNVLSGKMIDGDWSDTGYYGITDDDRVCLSMTNDQGRLRCLTLLKADDTVKKYNADGDMTFELLEFQEGNQL